MVPIHENIRLQLLGVDPRGVDNDYNHEYCRSILLKETQPLGRGPNPPGTKHPVPCQTDFRLTNTENDHFGCTLQARLSLTRRE